MYRISEKPLNRLLNANKCNLLGNVCLKDKNALKGQIQASKRISTLEWLLKHCNIKANIDE